ncbi:hypothetical protein FA13DRAFT_1331819 [Coprinellus micaceus]|uniref:Uncharacterized protein n=1 Tax=Coprinellus micaceus TaxID=71717 RepID=A0A4Y7TM37_COPMI|nr:hypothetical protein FA13DRAFT_1331819 [Coprinellus micaceus]
MSFFSRASLHHPPPPSRASSSTAVENDIKRPPIPPFEPIENKLSRKLKRKPAPQIEEKEVDVPAKWAEGKEGKAEATPALISTELPPTSTTHKHVPEKKNIMRRVSSIFKGKSKVTPSLNVAGKTAPSAWNARNAIGTMYIAEEGRSGAYESDVETCESEDDIRRPSGLGSAVSLMIPPSPSWLRLSNQALVTKPCGSTESDDTKTTADDASYARGRATSTPNLIRSITVKAKDKIRKGVQVARRASQSYSRGQEIASIAGTFASLPPIPKPSKAPQFPAELLDLVLPHLPPAADRGNMSPFEVILFLRARQTLQTARSG